MTWPREDPSGIAPIVVGGFLKTVEDNFYRYVVARDTEGHSKGAVMYFWKCWRETRVSFYVFLFIAVTLAALLWKIMDFTMSELPPKQLFALAWVILLFTSSALLGLAAISFGATGI